MTTLIPKFDLKNGGTTPLTAVNRPIYDKLAEVVSIKDLGAKGDGTTDDTLAIQAALDLNKTVYTPIYFPEGTYLVSDDLIFTATSNNPFIALKLFGAGNSGTTNPTVVPNATGGAIIKTTKTTGTLLTITGNAPSSLLPIEISDLQFIGPDEAAFTTTGNGLSFTTTISGAGTKLRLNNVNVSGFGGTGVFLEYVENSLINALTANYCNIGIHLGGATNANVFNFLEVQENKTTGLYIGDTLGNTFNGALIQGNRQNGLHLYGAKCTTFVSPYIENNNYTNTANCFDVYIRSASALLSVNFVTFISGIFVFVNGGIYTDTSGGVAYSVTGLLFQNCRAIGAKNVTFIGGNLISSSITNSGFTLVDASNQVQTEAWRDWIPTIGNATAGVGAIGIFKFRIIGNAIEYYVRMSNYSVTASAEVTLTLPLFANYYAPSANSGCFATLDGNTQQIRINKTSTTTWTAGDSMDSLISINAVIS